MLFMHSLNEFYVVNSFCNGKNDLTLFKSKKKMMIKMSFDVIIDMLLAINCARKFMKQLSGNNFNEG